MNETYRYRLCGCKANLPQCDICVRESCDRENVSQTLRGREALYLAI